MAVCDSIERELVLPPPVTRRQSRTIKAELFLRLLDMLFQIMDPWGCRSTLQTSKFKKYTIVSLAILYFSGSNLVSYHGKLHVYAKRTRLVLSSSQRCRISELCLMAQQHHRSRADR